MINPPESVERRYFIVRVRLKPAGPWSTPRDWWLCSDSGYPSHTAYWGGATCFDGKPTAAVIATYDGAPWYDQHDADVPPEIYEIVETRKVTRHD